MDVVYPYIVCFHFLCVPGASVNQINTEGDSPLTHAECSNHDEIVKLLQAALEQEGGELIENDGEPVCVGGGELIENNGEPVCVCGGGGS